MEGWILCETVPSLAKHINCIYMQNTLFTCVHVCAYMRACTCFHLCISVSGLFIPVFEFHSSWFSLSKVNDIVFWTHLSCGRIVLRKPLETSVTIFVVYEIWTSTDQCGMFNIGSFRMFGELLCVVCGDTRSCWFLFPSVDNCKNVPHVSCSWQAPGAPGMSIFKLYFCVRGGTILQLGVFVSKALRQLLRLGDMAISLKNVWICIRAILGYGCICVRRIHIDDYGREE